MFIKTGIDLTSIERIENLLKKYRENFKTRFFLKNEIIYCDSKPEPARSYAGHWAAKEAAFKVLGVGRHWRKIKLTHKPSGRPTLHLNPEIFRHPEVFIPETAAWDCSITHDAGVAAATALCFWD